jgi:TonB family protein
MWFLVLLFAMQIGVRITADPPLSPEQVAQLESQVLQHPEDAAARFRLLRYYEAAGTAHHFQRVQHLLYLIENSPARPAVAGHSFSHPAVRDAWLRAAERSSGDAAVVVNAARALLGADLRDAQDLLRRALDRDPNHRQIGATLGFLYAMEILNMGSPADPDRARSELERSQNALVIAGAGVALPNLFPRSPQARNPEDRSAFELSSRLMTRARELAPDDPVLRGPMPLIAEFQEFQRTADVPPAPVPPPAPPGVLRVAPEIQAARLVEKPEPVYPPLAAQARLQGRVRFDVLIGHDGTIENITVLSGHPLLVPAAMEAVRRYRYQPTLLNGVPTQVLTTVELILTLSRNANQ